MKRFIILILTLSFISCNSMGIKLSETLTNPSLKSCNSQSEVRDYKILFMLPFRSSIISELKLENTSQIQSIHEYAKPWDIGVTFLGFLVSLTSSTKVYTFCSEAEMKQSQDSEKIAIQLPHYKSVLASNPTEQLIFSKDDYQLGETEKLKLVKLAQTLLKSEEKFQVFLVGKTNTSGDIAYQTRLTKRRTEEIKAVFTGESLDVERVQTVFTDKDFGGTDSVSTIAIFLVKE